LSDDTETTAAATTTTMTATGAEISTTQPSQIETTTGTGNL